MDVRGITKEEMDQIFDKAVREIALDAEILIDLASEENEERARDLVREIKQNLKIANYYRGA